MGGVGLGFAFFKDAPGHDGPRKRVGSYQGVLFKVLLMGVRILEVRICFFSGTHQGMTGHCNTRGPGRKNDVY